MCDNTNIHDRVQASIATATREVDTALESVRAMRRAILAQMAEATADLETPTLDEVAKAIDTIRKHNADTDRGIYLEQGEYMDLMQYKRQVEAINNLVDKLENDPTGDAPVMSYKTAAYRIKLALEGAL
jgi:hypothetical protein